MLIMVKIQIDVPKVMWDRFKDQTPRNIRLQDAVIELIRIKTQE